MLSRLKRPIAYLLDISLDSRAGEVMLAQKALRFAGDAAGLEKTLRFLQSVAQVVAALSINAVEAAPWLQARKQLALGRRYLRFLKFFDAFSMASKTMSGSVWGLLGLLEVGKWSCLGMYLFLESCTIMDAMGVWDTAWAPYVFVEAMRFWFFSLSCSFLSSLLQLLQLHLGTPTASTEELKGNGEDKQLAESQAVQKAERNTKSQSLVRKAVTDACDLLIPGATTGWIVTSTATVGVASAISTVLASKDIWERT